MTEAIQQVYIDKLYERIAIMDELIDVQRETIKNRDASIKTLMDKLDEAIQLLHRANKIIEDRQSKGINLWYK